MKTVAVRIPEAIEKEVERITKVEKFEEDGRYIGKIIIRKKVKVGFKTHLTIGIAGHVGSGKSTLIATLITGKKDLSLIHI